MKANANGISINYQIEGKDGAPWVTLSHSLGANLTMWDDQVAALEDDYRILRLDTRGHGGTEATGGAYDFNRIPFSTSSTTRVARSPPSTPPPPYWRLPGS